MKSFSLYVHFPFCVSKCRYCDFVSRPEKTAGEIEKYLEYLKREIYLASLRPGLRGAAAGTVYFGGGTPSLMTAGQFEGLMQSVKDAFPFLRGAEVSIEANPASVKDSAEWMQRVRAAGVNRINIGVQSFNDEELALLGRAHTAGQAETFYDAARAAGFQSVGLDLIYGLPGSTKKTWLLNVEKAVALNAEHVSMYCLEILTGTPLGAELAAGRIAELPEELQAEMYYEAGRALREAGYERYEISNFAKPGRESRHNMAYWTGNDYLGVGVAACSCIDGARARNESVTEKYFRKIERGMRPLSEEERMGGRRRLREAAVMRLRTSAGFSAPDFSGSFPVGEISLLERDARELVSGGLMENINGRYTIPAEKLFVSDSIFSRLI